ncbi:MAG: DUF503 domain-containing protein [Acetobacteraceae bacterium]|nr:DUF503 domain-containing protein [Acetobacteraceae bacterium]
MVVGVLKIELALPENGSLKDKRRVLDGLMERLRRRFNVAVAEVGGQDCWQRAVLGVACVSSEGRHANQVLSRVVEWMDRTGRGWVCGYDLEIL